MSSASASEAPTNVPEPMESPSSCHSQPGPQPSQDQSHDQNPDQNTNPISHAYESRVQDVPLPNQSFTGPSEHQAQDTTPSHDYSPTSISAATQPDLGALRPSPVSGSFSALHSASEISAASDNGGVGDEGPPTSRIPRVEVSGDTTTSDSSQLPTTAGGGSRSSDLIDARLDGPEKSNKVAREPGSIGISNSGKQLPPPPPPPPPPTGVQQPLVGKTSYTTQNSSVGGPISTLSPTGGSPLPKETGMSSAYSSDSVAGSDSDVARLSSVHTSNNTPRPSSLTSGASKSHDHNHDQNHDQRPNPISHADESRVQDVPLPNQSFTDSSEHQARDTNTSHHNSGGNPSNKLRPRIVVYDNVVRDLQEDLRKAKDEIRHLTKELDNERSSLSAVTQDLYKSMGLAESRRQELRALENYHTAADRASASDVKGGVERLNYIIKHEVANMIRGFSRRKNFRATYQDVDQYLCIDTRLVDVLRNDLGEDESFMIRAALEATLVICARDVVSSWSLTSHSANREFAETYESIYRSEDQSIAGKWRSLSRAQRPKDNAELATVSEVISTRLETVFIVAGFDREESRNRIGGFAEGIGRIVRAALELNQLIGEQITSADFKVYSVQPGTSFDHGSMKDIECPRKPQDGRVLCTSALGLCRREGRPKNMEEIVMKPEVLVDYILNDLRTGQKQQDLRRTGLDRYSMRRWL